MALPARLKLNGREWTIEVVPDLAEKDDALGRCLRRTRVIRLEASQSEDEMESTLLHELLHAAWPRGVCDPEIEERIIRRLEPRLHPILTVRR